MLWSGLLINCPKKYFVVSIIVFLISSKGYSQNELRKLIYDDLVLLNTVNEYKIFDTVFNSMVVSENDTFFYSTPWKNLKKKFENVFIEDIDTVSQSFYKIKVHFNNILWKEYSLVDVLSFDYIVYKDYNNKLFKVDGFFLSDIMKIDPSKIVNIEKKYFRIRALISRHQDEKVRRMLKCSVMYQIHRVNSLVTYYPYMTNAWFRGLTM